MAVTRKHRCRKSGVKSQLLRATGEVKQDTPLKLSDNHPFVSYRRFVLVATLAAAPLRLVGAVFFSFPGP